MTATRRTLGLLARLKRQEVADLRRSSIAAEEDLVTLSRELVAHTESFSRELAPCESTAWLLGLHGGYVARSIDGTRRATTAKRSAEEEAAAAGDRLQEGPSSCAPWSAPKRRSPSASGTRPCAARAVPSRTWPSPVSP